MADDSMMSILKDRKEMLDNYMNINVFYYIRTIYRIDFGDKKSIVHC
jgi:hypothetical protein